MTQDSDNNSLTIYLALGAALLALIVGGFFLLRSGNSPGNAATTASTAAETASADAGSRNSDSPTPSRSTTPAVFNTSSNNDVLEVEIGEVYEFWMWGEEPAPLGVLKVVEIQRGQLLLETADNLQLWVSSNGLFLGEQNHSQPGDLSLPAKREFATKVVNDARILEAAIDQWAIEKNMVNSSPVEWDNIKEHVKETSVLYHNEGRDMFGNDYHIGLVGNGVQVNATSFDAVSEATDAGFWGSYAPKGAFEKQ